MTQSDFQERINHVIAVAYGTMGAGLGEITKAQIATLLTNAATAVTADTRTHDQTIEAPPAALNPGLPS